jgi:uncharacterized membrane protein YfcA
MNTETVALAVAIGVVAGTMSGLFGLAGGTVLVPLLALVLGLEEHAAQGVGLAVAAPTAVASAWGNARHGNVERRTALWMALGAVVGAYLGASLASEIDGPLLRRLFACLLLVMGVRVLPADLRRTAWRVVQRLYRRDPWSDSPSGAATATSSGGERHAEVQALGAGNVLDDEDPLRRIPP